MVFYLPIYLYDNQLSCAMLLNHHALDNNIATIESHA